jgi:hypothetical protein
VFAREGADLSVLQHHIHDEVPSLRDHVRGWVPDELEQIVRSLLAKEPEDRPNNARALAAQLRAIAIPEEHVWTQARAAAWWRSYSPPAMAQSTGEVRVIMPGRTKVQRPLAATDERAIAATMAGPTASTQIDRDSYPRPGGRFGDDSR